MHPRLRNLTAWVLGVLLAVNYAMFFQAFLEFQNYKATFLAAFILVLGVALFAVLSHEGPEAQHG